MRSTVRLLGVGAALVAALGACSGDDDDTTAAVATTTNPAATTTAGAATTTTLASEAGQQEDVTVALGETALGDTLVDGGGFTLYQFVPDAETPGGSACNDTCATAWPPVAANGDLVIGDGLDDSLFSTFVRSDDTQQVMVDGHPLYRFAADEKPGETNGHAVGGVWFATGPDGAQIPPADTPVADSTAP